MTHIVNTDGPATIDKLQEIMLPKTAQYVFQ